MTKQNGREVARSNDERLLKALHKFGWLRTRDIAALLWMPRLKRAGNGFQVVHIEVSPTARRMAQRTLRRLRQQHRVIWIHAPDGSTIYGLSEAGARQLVGLGIPAKSGKDVIRRVSMSHYHHRRLANELTISALLQGYRASSEHEIATGKWLGGMEGVLGKKPDIVVRSGKDAWFIEVERSAANRKGFEAKITFIREVYPLGEAADVPGELPDGHKLHQVVFVANPAFVARVCSDLRAAGWTEDMISRRIHSIPLLYVTEGKFITYEDRAEVASHA
jgi:hypothetical protein